MKSVILSCLLVGLVVQALPAQNSEKAKQRQRQALQKELDGTFRPWIDQDVAYIITPEERDAWKRLSTAEEREQFIEMFWRRRDPTPDTEENEYKEEHYRRIAYANEHFASGIPGWKTDRGWIYILHGPPDEIESHPSGGSYQRPPDQGGGVTTTYPFETWRYRHLEGVGDDILLEFVDKSQSGEYRLTTDPSEKDALQTVPGTAPPASRAATFINPDGTRVPQAFGFTRNQFDVLQQFVDVQRPPKIQFKDLATAVDSKIRYNVLPFQLRADFFRITSDSVLTAITVQLANRDLSFQTQDGVHRAVVNVFGRITNLSGRVVQTFEDIVRTDVPESLFQQSLERLSVYGQSLPLRPGRYRLSLALKDVNNGNLGTMDRPILVPAFDDEALSASSLVLADKMERVATREIGRGQFVIGATKLRPSVSQQFRRDGSLGVYLQVYNLRSPSGAKYEISRNGQVVFDETVRCGAAAQLTLERSIPLADLPPGQYVLRIRVTDPIANRTIAPETRFTVQ